MNAPTNSRELALKHALIGEQPCSPSALESCHGVSEQTIHLEGLFSEEYQVNGRVLSMNSQTGRATIKLTIPKGWVATLGSFSTDVEILVLDGTLQQGIHQLTQYSYSFIPKGVVVGPWQALTTVTLLWMPDKTPHYDTDSYFMLDQTGTAALRHKATQASRLYVPRKDIEKEPWQTTTFLGAGASRKNLFEDPESGKTTWVLGLAPLWSAGNASEIHHCSEEAYMLIGCMEGKWDDPENPGSLRDDTMNEGGYFWRPAFVPHGPFRTSRGCLIFFRSGSALSCDWVGIC